MEMKIQDYAARHGVTTEAVRKKVRKKPAELEGHVFRRNNATWLDDFAQQYLATTLEKAALIISDGAYQREMETLRRRNEELSDLLVQQSKELAAQKALVQDAQQTYLQLEASERDRAAEAKAHQDAQEKAAAELRAAEQEAEELREKLAAQEAARKEAEAMLWEQEEARKAAEAALAAKEAEMAAEKAKSKWEKFRDLFRKEG